MERFFNVNGDCKPSLHYMVDIRSKLEAIRGMIGRGEYFTINRARQYGKTTTLRALARFLREEYQVISLDFQMMSHADFENEPAFVSAFSAELLDSVPQIPQEIQEKLMQFTRKPPRDTTLSALFKVLSQWCRISPMPVVLIIDEVDSTANNQVFMDFLAQLRGYYINRDVRAAFQSVILAGVYDIKNIRHKLRADKDHKNNSPWNIAADFLIDMSFSAGEIAGMLADYEQDRHTGMNIEEMSRLLYDYTSGYPYLISRICKLIDERLNDNSLLSNRQSADEKNGPGEQSAVSGLTWTRDGFLAAIRILLTEPNTLFDSLINKLNDYPELEQMLRSLLFAGKEIAYVIGVHSIESALMFGFVKILKNQVVIANRIFETLLYNYFLAAPSMQQEALYDTALKDKPLFIENGRLNMRFVLERFVEHFDSLYGDKGQQFYEDDGRRYFMLFLKPIINGIGNCYVEAETRNRERTDLIVDYLGEQFVVEAKVWRGAARHLEGEEQLIRYLGHHRLKTGYMLTFNFNKKKELGIKEVIRKDKMLIEAFV